MENYAAHQNFRYSTVRDGRSWGYSKITEKVGLYLWKPPQGHRNEIFQGQLSILVSRAEVA